MPNFLKDTKKVVGCDLDDVLADFMKTFMTIGSAKFGIDPTVYPTSWEWDGVKYKTGLPLTKAEIAYEVDRIWDVVIATPAFWEKLDVMPNVKVDDVRELDRLTKLYFPTARAITADGLDVGQQSAYWLATRFGITFPTVFVSNEKGPLASALKYDYFIDDRPTNCQAIKKAAPNCKVFLMNASHNQWFNDLNFPRIYKFGEFAGIVLKGE